MSATVNDLFDLDGQVAIVTGGPGQLGSQICDALAELGAHVVVVARTEADCKEKAHELTANHQDALAVPADVTNEDAVERMVETVIDHFGRIDILVNNAYSGATTSFEEMTPDEFLSAFEGAALSTFLCSRAVIGSMRERGTGTILNVGSIYGLVAPDHRIYGDSGLDNPCNYGPAKAGVVQLTRWLAAKFGSDGIRVNCVTPGGFYNEDHEDTPDYQDVFVENYRHRTPLGRMGDETDLKGAIAFLASDASKWVTGENLVVDGGWTIW